MARLQCWASCTSVVVLALGCLKATARSGDSPERQPLTQRGHEHALTGVPWLLFACSMRMQLGARQYHAWPPLSSILL